MKPGTGTKVISQRRTGEEKEKIMKKKKAALTACSDPVSSKRLPEVDRIADILHGEGLEVVLPPVFFGPEQKDPAKKAEGLMNCFMDPDMDLIFDVSGGDLANTVLPFLDYSVIGKSSAVFFGYSDLTTVINALIAKTGKPAVNYQIRNILYDHADEQRHYLREKVLTGKIDAADLECHFLRGSCMQGRILGGNMRCFLKLAGTPFWPDPVRSILMLESLGGGVCQMMTALEQYKQMGVLDVISGILLGTFSRMEEEDLKPDIRELVMQMVPDDIPIASTRYIGHYTDARAVVLGQELMIMDT